MRGWVKDLYVTVVPYGTREVIKGHSRKHYYQQLRAGNNKHGYSLKQFDELRCVCIHIPKTAGISLCNTLFGCLGGGHISARTYRQIFGLAKYNEYYKFAFVRNPWDRLVSAYSFLKQGGLNGQDINWARQNIEPYLSFQEFVRNWLTQKNIYSQQHFIPQWEYVVDASGRVDLDFLGHFETLEDDFKTIALRLGVTTALPKSNASSRSGYREYYDAETADIVARLYSRDIELFDYKF